MDDKFASLVERLHPAYLRLISRAPVTGGATPAFTTDGGHAERGVYLFTKNGKHLYIGRSNRLFKRYKDHWEPNKAERDAAFAFKLARKKAGRKATYKKGEGTCKYLMLDPNFKAELKSAKEHIRAMEYRWTEEKYPAFRNYSPPLMASVGWRLSA